jgi:hypothetical protein
MNSRGIAVSHTDDSKRTKKILPAGKSATQTDEDIIRMEMRYYEQKKEGYLKEFEGKYIALHKGEVLDSDLNFSTLATRVYEKFGYHVFYMPFVTSNGQRLKISSPPN